eukprot:3865044-Prymnesium_polylepis.1
MAERSRNTWAVNPSNSGMVRNAFSTTSSVERFINRCTQSSCIETPCTVNPCSVNCSTSESSMAVTCEHKRVASVMPAAAAVDQ